MYMWKFFQKSKVVEKTKTIEEIILEMQIHYEEKQKEIYYRYEASSRELRHHYEEKMDEGRLYEKELNFEQVLQDAEKGTHPFEYTIERGSVHYTKVTLFRSKQSPNPYRITIELHKNCIFLSVTKGEREKVADSFITLYYDKVKKTYREFIWEVSNDYATKHHIRMFLYDMMKHVNEDTLHLYPHYKNEFRARDEFWAKEHVWKAEYEQRLTELTVKQNEEMEQLKRTYEREVNPYLMEVKTTQALKREKEKQEEQRQLEEQKQKEIEENQLLEQRVFDENVDAQMKHVYRYAQRLLEKEYLLEIEQAYELRRLYEKDLQELWRSFIQLEEQKQKQEKERFQHLLTRLEEHLQRFEERMVQVEQFDYEKKMKYMEKKYLS